MHQYTNAYWQGNTLYAVRRDDAGNVVIDQFPAQHAFFLRKQDATPDVLRALRDSRACTGHGEEGDWVRTKWRYDRPDYSKPAKHVQVAQWFEEVHKIKTFEADVSPVRRWVVENDIEIAKPRRCYLDIETDSRVPFSKKSEARILAWVVVGEGDGSVVDAGLLTEEDDDSEKTCLKALWTCLTKYDQVLSWNGDRFDFPMILERSKRVGLMVDDRRWLWLDHLVLFRRMNMSASESGDEKQSMSLESVGRAVCGEGKLAGISGAQSWELWAAGPESRGKLLDYCAQDADLMRKIEAKTGYVQLLQTLAESVRVFPDTYGINPSGQVESFLMMLAKKRHLRFPSHFHTDGGDRFAGAYVMDPTSDGVARDVHVADFARLYPSIIMSWNMSVETIRPDVRLTESAEGRPLYLAHLPLKRFPIPEGTCAAALTDVVFDNEPTGILSEAVSEMIRLRSYWNKKKASLPPGTEEWKDADRRSSAYKIAANSFYGVIGMPHSRFYVRSLAESVSQCGVWLIQKTIEAAKARGYDVIYGDTDSLFVTGTSKEEFDEFVKWTNTDLYPELMKSRGCTRNFTELAYEKAFERIVFVSAKRYVGRYSHYKGTAANKDSKPEIKGLEYKRGDVSKLTRAFQAEVMTLLMAGDDVPGPDVFEPIVEKWKTRILEGELDKSDIVISKRLAKPLNEYVRRTKKDGDYAAEPSHIAVARLLKAKGQDVGEGTKIGYVVVDGSASPLGVVPVDDWTGEFDRFYLWESLVYPPTQRLLAAAFPGHDWSRWESVRPPTPRAVRAAVRKLEKTAQCSLFARNDPGEEGTTNAPQSRVSSPKARRA